ncbi:MAG: flagellar motor switch protein FliG [Hydrogenophaga sp.]|jgi:flagellar motor switch protein FliG|uniref:FliG C-terminal domain-containing protein n=1 Tax=Hydrogenophaga sp. TaxID=1904254 RepID=UPI002611C1E4|nr:FliG C-terminal domain-containing protein [Hydrogenophaga sp.]MCW5671551.1 flagellar motor switch protein FliG [Hydrogenophaga sp.]
MPPSPDLQGPDAGSLSSTEQAAIVLLSMGEQPAAAVLQHLSREELLDVTQVMSRMSGIKVDMARAALQRFFDDYREQSGVHGASRAYLKSSLDMALGSNIASSVLTRIYGDAIRPKMARLQWASSRWIAERIAAEHEHMQAVFLAFLPSALASEVIERLPEDNRDLVLMQIAQLGHVEHDILRELEVLVDAYLASLETQSATVEGVRQAAEIINRMPGNRQKVVEQMRARDPAVVAQIEVSMYDFFILSRQSEDVITRIIEASPLDLWAVALKGADPEVRRKVLQAMPRRQAQAFEDTLRRTGPVPLSRVEQARAEIMREVKALADSDEIQIQLFAEAVVA